MTPKEQKAAAEFHMRLARKHLSIALQAGMWGGKKREMIKGTIKNVSDYIRSAESMVTR